MSILEEEHIEKMQQLHRLLFSFDWNYHYTDDKKVRAKAENDYRAIQSLLRETGRDGARLYQAFRDITYGPHTGDPYRYPEQS